jgi:hypothetical protein
MEISEEELAQKISDAVAVETAGLKTKRDELLDEVKTTKSKFAEYKSPAEVQTLQAQLDEARKGTGTEDAVRLALSDADAKHTETLRDLKTKLEVAETTATDQANKFNRSIIDTKIREQAIKAGVLPEALEDVCSRAGGVFVLDSEGKLEARDGTGQLLKDASGERLVTPDSYMEGLQESNSYYFGASKGSGAPGSHKAGQRDVKPELEALDTAAKTDFDAFTKMRRPEKEAG